MKSFRPLLAIWPLWWLVGVSAVGCSGGNGQAAGKPTDNASGIDVTQYAAFGPLGQGSPVTLAGGPSLEAPVGAVSADVLVGIRPAVREPKVPEGWHALSPWYDLASNRSDVRAAPGTVIRLTLPAEDPLTTDDHPGIALMAVLPTATIPIDGRYNRSTGALEVEVLGLPPTFTVCAAFNPTRKRMAVEEEISGAVQGLRTRRLGNLPARGATPFSLAEPRSWPTQHWTVHFDEHQITVTEAQNVVRWAQTASEAFAAAGLREPRIYRDTWQGLERWHIHLTADGSHYRSPHDGVADELARRFGRIYLSVTDIRRTQDDPIGSGFGVLAHELFHASFDSYDIPYCCFEQIIDGVNYCYQSHTGFNEGLATALGYFLDQGEAKPRPNEGPATLEEPHGNFSSLEAEAAYRNQDFFVFFLRMNGLSVVSRYLEALASAVIGRPTDVETALVPYALALENNGLGLPERFSVLYQTYVVDRGYIRTEFGHIWPTEPYPEEPGKPYTYAPGLFPHSRTVKRSDCQFEAEGATCVVTLSRMPPLSARVLLVDFADGEVLPLGMSWADGFSARFRAEAKSGSVGLTIFGERDGEGNPEAHAGSRDGTEVTLPDAGKRWTNAKVFVVRGVGEPEDVTLTMTFGTATLSPICQQWVEVYCLCVVPGVQPIEVCREQTRLTVQQACERYLPHGMTCDEYCAGQVETYSGTCP